MGYIFHPLNVYLDVAECEKDQEPNKRNYKRFQINKTANEHIDKEPKFIVNADVLEKSDEW